MPKAPRAPRKKKAVATAPENIDPSASPETTLTDLKSESEFTPSPSLNYPHREEKPASLTHFR